MLNLIYKSLSGGCKWLMLLYSLKESLPAALQHSMSLAQEKGATSWLTALPVEEFGFTLHKGAFRDALALHYGWCPTLVPTHCMRLWSVFLSFSCPLMSYGRVPFNETK